MEKILLLLVLMFNYGSSDRSYETECPAVTPMPDFNMRKFFGIWYQVQPDLDTIGQTEEDIPSCEFYNIGQSQNPNVYVVNTMFELYDEIEGERPHQYDSVSTNYLMVFGDEPAQMSFAPPTVANIIESNFTVFATDYKTFAVISNCDKETNENGVVEFSQHTTLWSRTRNLGEIYVEKLYENMGSLDFDPYDLSSISKTGCIEGTKKLITVDLINDKVYKYQH